MSLPRIYRDDNYLYLIQDISGLSLYDKSKAIVNFCDKETKRFEKEIDTAILEIFEKNGINIPNTEKSVLKLAFDLLKSKGKRIDVEDIYKQNDLQFEEGVLEVINETKNHFIVALETDIICGIKKEILQCGVQISERGTK